MSISLVNCQSSSFEYIYSTQDDEAFSDILEHPDGSIFFCIRSSTIDHPFNRASQIIELDYQGAFINKWTFNYPGKSFFISNISISASSDFILAASFYDTLGTYTESGLALMRLNSEMTMIDSIEVFLPSEYSIGYVNANISTEDQTIIGGAISNGNNVPRPFLYIFNSGFKLLNSKIYLDRVGISTNMKKLSDDYYWFYMLSDSKYFICDTLLNIIQKQWMPDYLSGNCGVKWDTDTSFYLVGDKIYPTPNHNLGFIKQFHPMDTTGHIFNQWGISDTIDFPALVNGIDFKAKDSIYIGGTRDFFLGNYNKWPSWFIILQTDSMLNVRWERFYGGDAYYEMGKIIATQDGGCLVGGTRYDYQNVSDEQTDIIILKLDKNGILVGNKEYLSMKLSESIVYPNPGTNEIKVRIATQHPESLFELFDMNGKQIVSQEISGKWGTINTTFLNPGTYIYRITSEQGLFESGKWIKQ